MSSKLVKILLGLAGLLLLLVLVGGVVFYVWLNRWLAGDECRRLVSQLVSEELKIDGDFQAFRWSGFSVYSEGFEGSGRAGGSLRRIRAEQIRADLNLSALFRGTWEISQIEVARIQADLGEVEGVPPPSLPPEDPAAGGGGGLSFLPSKFLLKKMKIAEANLTWPAEGKEPGRIRGTQINVESDGPDWKFFGRGGKFHQPEIPEMDLDSFQARFKPPRNLYVDFALAMPGEGTISGRGEADLGPGGLLQMNLDLRNIDVAPFLAEDWRARFSGRVSGPMELKTEIGKKDGMKAKGSLKVSGGKVEAFPVLNQVALLTQTQEFRSLKLKTAQTNFEWEKGRIALKDLLIESELLLKITGEFLQANEKVDGTLQVGTVPTVLKFLPGAKEKVFTRSEGGYIWTEVKVSGTADAVKEDLTPRLKDAALGAAADAVGGGLEQINKGMESGAEEINKGLDKALDFLNKNLPLP